jgi:DNA-binding CsgD family transcriptional regulator
VAAESADRARSAWHRAAALADELEAMTDDDAVLERAALLTVDPVNRARRFVAAAESARRGGRGGLALALASEAQRLTTDPSALRVRALVEADAGSPSDAAALLLAEGLLPDALAVAADHGDARAALAAAAGLGTPLAYGLAEILAGQGPEGLRSLRASGSADAVVLLYLGDFEAARQALAAAVAPLRADGANGLLPAALGRLAFAEAAEGRLAAAGATAAEGLRLAEETGQLTWACRHRALLAWAAAAAGREEECRAAAQDAFRLAARHGLGLSADIAAAALGELELALGRPEEALARFSELSHHLVRVAAAPSLVEAAARAGQSDVASAASAALEAWIDADAPPRLHALLERCRALCSEGDEAIAHFDEALRLRADARTRLLYGEFLRRARRRREARAQLQSALDAFERLDAGAWAERARAELRGSGIVVQRGDRSLAEQLTPQELQVARLVAAGATNKHVAAQLYLSPRTIDFHLRNVYAKLGITSRFQLVALRADLDSGDSAGAKLRLAA